METSPPLSSAPDARLLRQLQVLRRSLAHAQGRASGLKLLPEEAKDALAGDDPAVMCAARMVLARLLRSHRDISSGSALLGVAIKASDRTLLSLLGVTNRRQEQLERARNRRRLADRAAEREAKRARLAAIDPALHGLIGYNEYECRCGKCRYAYTKDRKQRALIRKQRARETRQAKRLAQAERLAAMDAALHGVVGYTEYGCRCVTCREGKTKAGIEAWRSRPMAPQDWTWGKDDPGTLLEDLRRSLCARYKGVTLEDFFSGEVIETPQGPCLDIQTEVLGVGYPALPSELIEAAVLSDLRLLDRVGPATMAKLQARGYLRITDLVDDYIYGPSATLLASAWTDRRLEALHQRLLDRLGGQAGASLGVNMGCLVPREKVAVVDLETLGLYDAPVFLFGIAEYSETGLNIHQFLARSGAEEPAALLAALGRLSRVNLILTYNGRAADLPWLRQRAAYYRLGPIPEPLHLDLLPVVRHRKRRKLFPGAPLIDCRLPTVTEVLLGVARDPDDVPSGAIPGFYKWYEKEHNIGPLVPIVQHNRADLVAVGHLFSKLLSEVCSG